MQVHRRCQAHDPGTAIAPVEGNSFNFGRRKKSAMPHDGAAAGHDVGSSTAVIAACADDPACAAVDDRSLAHLAAAARRALWATAVAAVAAVAAAMTAVSVVAGMVAPAVAIGRCVRRRCGQQPSGAGQGTEQQSNDGAGRFGHGASLGADVVACDHQDPARSLHFSAVVGFSGRGGHDDVGGWRQKSRGSARRRRRDCASGLKERAARAGLGP